MITTSAPLDIGEIATCFPLPGAFVSAVPYGNGHINETYLVVTGEARRHIFQKINHRIFRDVPALMENIQRVTSHLAARSPRALTLVPARDGAPCARDTAGHWWRAYAFIEGAHTVDQVTEPRQAREAARAFGEFQAQLADLPGGRLHETIPRFHDTRRRFEALQMAIQADVRNRAAGVHPEIEFALAREGDTGVLLGLLERGEVQERVTHNDTKINNVMLDDATGRGVSVIDLDTVMPGLALYDFGDMVRTSTSTAAEDDPVPSRMRLQLPLYRALVEGYLETAGDTIGAAERAHLGFAGQLMSYEVGIRFLSDYLAGDVYFRTRYPEHNLVRARTQFALVRSIEEQSGAMARVVAEVHGC
ncbi:MAG TPA: aminoglycoside phosphotransferase family protein [Opitutaceae bacterium]